MGRAPSTVAVEATDMIVPLEGERERSETLLTGGGGGVLMDSLSVSLGIALDDEDEDDMFAPLPRGGPSTLPTVSIVAGATLLRSVVPSISASRMVFAIELRSARARCLRL